MSDLLKAVEEAAYRLARAQAARDVIQRSLDGIIAEQKRRAEAKAAAMKAKESGPPTNKNLH
jgi:peptidoglycan hydrolase CwlO-like protein